MSCPVPPWAEGANWNWVVGRGLRSLGWARLWAWLWAWLWAVQAVGWAGPARSLSQMIACMQFADHLQRHLGGTREGGVCLLVWGNLILVNLSSLTSQLTH